MPMICLRVIKSLCNISSLVFLAVLFSCKNQGYVDQNKRTETFKMPDKINFNDLSTIEKTYKNWGVPNYHREASTKEKGKFLFYELIYYIYRKDIRFSNNKTDHSISLCFNTKGELIRVVEDKFGQIKTLFNYKNEKLFDGN